MIEAGREELTKEFRREGLPLQRIWDSKVLTDEVASSFVRRSRLVLAAIGEHHVSARSIAQKVARGFSQGADGEQFSRRLADPPRSTERPRSAVGVHVEGLDDILVRLSRCCTPVPGDDIVGFVTQVAASSVHRTDCANAESLMSDQAARLIDVDWDGDRTKAIFRAGVEVVALDRSRLLRDVANALSEQHVNIVSCSTHTGGDRVAKMRFEFELADPSHLEAVLRTIKQIDAVYDAYRLVPGKGG